MHAAYQISILQADSGSRVQLSQPKRNSVTSNPYNNFINWKNSLYTGHIVFFLELRGEPCSVLRNPTDRFDEISVRIPGLNRLLSDILISVAIVSIFPWKNNDCGLENFKINMRSKEESFKSDSAWNIYGETNVRRRQNLLLNGVSVKASLTPHQYFTLIIIHYIYLR